MFRSRDIEHSTALASHMQGLEYDPQHPFKSILKCMNLENPGEMSQIYEEYVLNIMVVLDRDHL